MSKKATNKTKKLMKDTTNDEELLNSIDKAKLKDAIEYFCKYRNPEWVKSKVVGKTEDGKDILSWPYVSYTEEAWYYIDLMEPDFDYIDNYKKYCENTLPTDMNVHQIRTMFTYIQQGERFCDGLFRRFIKDGTILKYLLRLDDLLSKLDIDSAVDKIQ